MRLEELVFGEQDVNLDDKTFVILYKSETALHMETAWIQNPDFPMQISLRRHCDINTTPESPAQVPNQHNIYTEI